ncbi:MAG: putative zinc- or iron-chelating domain [Polyangiaceae bacterium]|nr:putative zinc- or iron-chelating domain [Polyangiaceae bacterium]
MANPLAFRCTGCGNCCRSLRVAVTARDALRLANATERPLSHLVEWLAPNEVDMGGEPESFVELREGRRLMVLAQRGGACVLLGENDLCRAYAARPRDCRAFPFDFEATSDGRRRLTLLPLSGCDYAEDGQNDEAALASEDAARWQELKEYQRWVAAWNRRAWHRKRLHKSVGSAAEFLQESAVRLRASD